jgi:hypothetical protein
MNAIGGYFQLQLPSRLFDYHDEALALSNGRACLRHMLVSQPMKACYLPSYACDAIYHPFEMEDVPYRLYSINEALEPATLPKLEDGEFFLYIDYFGLRGAVVEQLIGHYGDRLIVDNTHAFFRKRVHDNWSFTAARKYFGVPDGAFLYGPRIAPANYPRFDAFSLEHGLLKLHGQQHRGFEAYSRYEASLGCRLNRISIYSERLLSTVDLDDVQRRRIDNYRHLHDALESFNQLEASLPDGAVPFTYPLLPSQRIERGVLHAAQVFVPSLWRDPLDRPQTASMFELELAKWLLPLPIDHRYGRDDMQRMIELIYKVLDR